MEFFDWIFEMFMPRMLGIYESSRKDAPFGTDCRHSCHGAGKTLGSSIGPASQTSMLAGGQESHAACLGGRTVRCPGRTGRLCPLPATNRAVCRTGHPGNSPEHRRRKKKESIPPQILLAQEEEIQQLISRFESEELHGQSVAQLEVLVRTAVFKSANALVGWLLQKAAERADA